MTLSPSKATFAGTGVRTSTSLGGGAQCTHIDVFEGSQLYPPAKRLSPSCPSLPHGCSQPAAVNHAQRTFQNRDTFTQFCTPLAPAQKEAPRVQQTSLLGPCPPPGASLASSPPQPLCPDLRPRSSPQHTWPITQAPGSPPEGEAPLLTQQPDHLSAEPASHQLHRCLPPLQLLAGKDHILLPVCLRPPGQMLTE